MRIDNFNRRIYGGFRRIGIPLLALMLFTLALPQEAEAGYFGHRHYGHFSSHFGFHGRFGSHLGFHRHFGGPFGHYPSYYSYSPRFALPYARQAGLGAVDLDIKPKKAEVYVDGRYVGLTREFDGYPNFLWLKEGTHQLVFHKDGYGTMVREYTVYPGEVINVKFRLEPGDSVPPEEFLEDPVE